MNFVLSISLIMIFTSLSVNGNNKKKVTGN